MKKKLALVSFVALGCLGLIYWVVGCSLGTATLIQDDDLKQVKAEFEQTAPILHDLCRMKHTHLDCGGVLNPLVQKKDGIIRQKYENNSCLWGVRYTLWVHDPITGPELATAQAVDMCWIARL